MTIFPEFPLSLLVHAFNPSTWESGRQISMNGGQPGLWGEIQDGQGDTDIAVWKTNGTKRKEKEKKKKGLVVGILRGQKM